MFSWHMSYQTWCWEQKWSKQTLLAWNFCAVLTWRLSDLQITDPAIQLPFVPQVFRKTNSTPLSGNHFLGLLWLFQLRKKIALAKQYDEISSGFLSPPAFCRGIRITSGAASDPDCTRLTSAKFPKLSLMNQVVLWILSHQRPAAVLIRQHQRVDIAAPTHTRNTHDQSFNRCVTAVFVCLIYFYWSRLLVFLSH